jgi:hypothetical protein
MDFGYGDIVAILGKMADANMIVSSTGPQTKANFVLQDLPGYNRDVNTAPIIPEGPRPIAATPQEQATP